MAVRSAVELPPAWDGAEQPALAARTVSARVSLGTRLREIVRSRELFVFLVRKELKVKYKGSVLGLLWSMLNPAVTLIVYDLVFTYFLKSGIPNFALYLFSGLIVWNLFLTALLGSASTIVANAGIVKKVSFPREILAFAQVGTSAVFFFFQAIVLAIFLVGFQHPPDWAYMPVLFYAFIDLILFTSALAIFLSAVNVYLRDVEHLIAVLLNAWFWAVPIIYSFNRVYQHSVWLARLYLADPMTVIILSFQRAIYGQVTYTTPVHSTVPVLGLYQGKPAIVGSKQVTTHVTSVLLANYSYNFYLVMLTWVLVASAALLLGAMIVFGRIEGNFAEEL